MGSSSAAKSVMQRSEADPLPCPRCNSSNTKFCYYNNYSLSQPRHFCKACKRYWTRGGTLRNVPIGGKAKKFKRPPPPPAATPSIPNTMPTTFNFPFSETRVSSETPRFDGSGFSPYLQDRPDFISFGSSNLAQHTKFSMPYDEMQMAVGNGQVGRDSNQIDQWNSNNNVGVWFDPSSSLPSLI